MAYNSSAINKSNRINTTPYASVSRFKNAAYTALDDYQKYANDVRSSAYRQKYDAIEKKLTNAKSDYDSSLAASVSAAKKSRAAAYSAYNAKNVSTGVTADSLASAGLKNSGYEKALGRESYETWQSAVAETEDRLKSESEKYRLEYDKAVQQGDEAKASLALTKANNAAAVEKQVMTTLISIGRSVFSYNKQLS